MRPTLRQLEYFVAVAEERGFQRAADTLYVSQPALSQQIRELEGRLGARLFDRAPGNIQLTSIGTRLLGIARAVLDQSNSILEIARSSGGALMGELRIGAISTVSPYLVAPALATLRRAHPALQVLVTDSETVALERALRRGALDVLLLALMDPRPGTEQLPLFQEPFVVLAPASSAIGQGEGPVTASELEGEPIILLSDAHCFRRHALSVCDMVDAHPHAGVHATSLTTLVEMVRAGLGMTLLPVLAMHAHVCDDPKIRARPLHEPQPARTLGLVWRSGTARAREYEYLAESLRNAASSAELARAWGLTVLTEHVDSSSQPDTASPGHLS